MDKKMVAPKPMDFKFLRTLADKLESMSPPYLDVQSILISKIDDMASGKHRNYAVQIYGTRNLAAKIQGGAALQHLDDCPWV